MKMTPKEKAWSIFWNFKNIPDKWKNEKVFQNYYAKQCALLAVYEILNSRKEHLVQSIKFHEYWTEVKRELERL